MREPLSTFFLDNGCMNAERKAVWAWLHSTMETKGLNPTSWAKATQKIKRPVAPSTVGRFYKDPEHEAVPGIDKISALAEAAKVPSPIQISKEDPTFDLGLFTEILTEVLSQVANRSSMMEAEDVVAISLETYEEATREKLPLEVKIRQRLHLQG